MSEQDTPDADGNSPDADTDAGEEGANGGEDGANGAPPFEDVVAGIDDLDVEAGIDKDGGIEPDEGLVERVEESDPESIARELAALRAGVGGLEAELDAREEELDEVTSQLKRKQADFQNYKKRMEKRREQEKQRATEDLVERLLDVRDNLVRALDQADPDADADAGDIRDGVESTLREFDRVLEDENVAVVDPDPGESVDPQRHEVLMRVASDRPADTIADVHRPGYVMAGKVLRPAQVTVSEGSDDGDDADDGDGSGTGDDA